MDRKDRLDKKKSSWPLVIGVVFMGGLIAVALAGFVGYQWLLSPLNTQDNNQSEVTIAPGSSVKVIAAQLVEENIIRHPWSFILAVRQANLGSKIQAGDFILRSSMSPKQIAQAMTKAQADQVSIKILEGWRKEEIAEELEDQLTADGIDFDAEIFLSQPEIKEGYVFPDTYFVARTTNEQAIAKTIEANFNQKIATIQEDLDASPYTIGQILTMASIIEREARTDRRIVSGILWNRIEIGMPLQVDASWQYIKGYSALTDEWWQPPLAADRELESPYNTYLYPGLPPGPIANPSLSSIEAAANPAQTDYLYYITAPDGTMHYGETYDQHLVNVNRYLR